MRRQSVDGQIPFQIKPMGILALQSYMTFLNLKVVMSQNLRTRKRTPESGQVCQKAGGGGKIIEGVLVREICNKTSKTLYREWVLTKPTRQSNIHYFNKNGTCNRDL